MGGSLIIPYCSLEPTEKQRLFLTRETKEAFFGGAAGGGKSVALLMGALKYVEQPGYAALIIRKDLPRLELAGGLIPRSHEWFAGTKAKWNGARRTWSFPIKDYLPATITFGYLANPRDKYRYASSEFQYIAFDELTDFQEEDYLFLFSRLRRREGVKAKLRMRSASNPGGTGRLWVKQRFIEGAIGEHGRSVVFMKEGRCYIPSRITDNPYLSGEEYRQTLEHLPPVEREQLMHGDWDVQAEGLFHEEWFRYYVETSGQVELQHADGSLLAVVPEGSCHRFLTIDPAGTSEEKAKEKRGYAPSWTVVQVWDQPKRELGKYLILREQLRQRVDFKELCDLIRETFGKWKPKQVWIEGENLGVATAAHLKGERMPIETIGTGVRDKKTRAGLLTIKLGKGEVFLPKYESSWRAGFEAELLAWTGDERQQTDQIDAAAYAAIVASSGGGGVIRLAQ